MLATTKLPDWVAVSQLALSVTVHVRVPVPVLDITMFCVEGLFPPAVALNERLVGLMPMVG